MSGITRVVLSGDEVAAGQHLGRATLLLYVLKNRMQTGALDSLESTHNLPDGTTIRVSSRFGNDQITIDTPKISPIIVVPSVSEEELCVVKIGKVPSVIQPMRYPGEIRPGEISGTDFIKTYYTADLSNCPNCEKLNWTLSFSFKTKDPVIGTAVDSKTGLIIPNDHLVQTIFGPGWGQVIKGGKDKSGGFILWKAYTEGSPKVDASEFPMSRTGLGWIKLILSAVDSSNKKVCSSSAVVRVDCCKKAIGERHVEIWDESTLFGDHRDFMFVGGDIYYKTPNTVKFFDLCLYALLGSGSFFIFPEIQGACSPYIWSLSGPGRLETSGKNSGGLLAQYFPPEDWLTECNAVVSISVSDRCGEVDLFEAKNCCEEELGSPVISYTSLLMGCGASQYFEALGGCPPYSWSLMSGGGTLSASPTSPIAMYTAPAQNANCGENPTIQVSDCCGKTAQIMLAVNCYPPSSPALKYCGMVMTGVCKCGSCSPSTNACEALFFPLNYKSSEYDCNGTQGFICEVDGFNANVPTAFAPDCIAAPNCNPVQMPKTCTGIDACTEWIESIDCNLIPFCTDCTGVPCNVLTDVRTAGQLSGGCCPINPLTGLPY